MRVLFVCMGNICRSPTAAGVFRLAVERAGLTDQVEIESAGTHAYHEGGGADRRAMRAAAARGIDISGHVARAVEIDDFRSFDYILAMDCDNRAHLLSVAPKDTRATVELFLKYAPEVGVEEVPDPYYGGGDGFDRVLDLVTAAADGFLAQMREKGAKQRTLER